LNYARLNVFTSLQVIPATMLRDHWRMLKVSREMLADAADALLNTISYYWQLFMLRILIVVLWSKWENWAFVFGAFARESSRNALLFA